ncbi:hypothetical protein BSFA1_14710 [Burkholderia sp. SFA1]|nr:uncharacterized protein BRPE67_ACDS13930 [Burkholderia sp. RPE67]BBP96342.1 hypothetical protein BSFA1_14710 [Burkholderia sp. SFA1]
MSMSRTTVDMLRAYLMTASIVAVCINGGIVIAVLIFHMSDTIFEGSLFRFIAVCSLAVSIMAVRHRAMRAFRRALECQNVFDAGFGRPVLVDSSCPSLALVILYLRLARKEFVIRP